MGKRWWLVVVALVVGVVALAYPRHPDHGALAGPSGAAPATTSAETPHPAAPRTVEEPAPDLSAAVARAVAAAGDADLGLAVVDLRTGAAAGHDADTPFRSASLSKLVVAVDLLTSGEVPAADLDRLARALSLSDDDAMNALWTLHDGMGAIDRVAAQAGLTATRAPADASQWGDVEMSAGDVARLYRYIATRLPDAQRDVIVDALSAASPTAADGFDQAYGLLAPGVGGYAKQGWMWYLPADLYLHTSGVVGDRYAIAALSVQTGVAEQAAKDRLTAVTDALIAGLTPAA
ncbi:hypothetical protein ACFXGA_28145 [Actinosynnema sp. NPDC059335]|uniref:hypothetical protein n=1 Tax=Actinosynnema sp. NPDC059335 TaxID=3346804 RepID=UPI00366BE348